MPDLCLCTHPDGRTALVPILARPLPSLAVIGTPEGDSFSLTHERSGLALGFFRTQAEAESAARFCETVDWTVFRDEMGQAHQDAFSQVQWSAQMYAWEKVGEGLDGKAGTLREGKDA